MMTIACNSHQSNHLFNAPSSLICHHWVVNVDNSMGQGRRRRIMKENYTDLTAGMSSTFKS